jgi:hypothetical protein
MQKTVNMSNPDYYLMLLQIISIFDVFIFSFLGQLARARPYNIARNWQKG